MKLSGDISGGEKTSNREVIENEWKDFPAFWGGQKISETEVRNPENRQAQIDGARDAVKNAYRRQKTTGEKVGEMNFETVEQKTKDFFEAIQGLTDGMNLYYGTRSSWPQNSREFVDKFGGDEFKPQNSGDLYAKISFATTLIDAEIRRRNAEKSATVSNDEKRKIFNSFSYPLYKVYIPPAMGGAAWKGFNENKFQIFNPEAGLGGAYEKFFGSDNNPERKALAEKAIESYSALMPFMDTKTGHRAISEFLTNNRDRQINGFRKTEQKVSIVDETVNLFNLRDNRDEEISNLEDAIVAMGHAEDSYTRQRVDMLSAKIHKLSDERVIIEWLIKQYPGQEKIDNNDVKKKIEEYIDEQNRLFDIASAKRNQSAKDSEDFKNYTRTRDAIRRWGRAAERVLGSI